MAIVIPAVRLSLEGAESSFKSSAALTAPTPSVLFAFDGGFLRAIHGLKSEWWKGLDIHVVEYDPKATVESAQAEWHKHDITIFRLPRPIQTDQVRKLGFRVLWNYFNSRIAQAAMDGGYLRSVIVDTMTLARDVRADAHLQAYQDSTAANQQMRVNLTQIEYGPIHDAVKDIYLNYESAGVNLIATHHLRDQRKQQPVFQKDGTVSMENLPTGEMELQGWGDTYRAVDMALRLEMVQDGAGKASGKATFQKSGFNPDLKGSSLTNMTWNSLMAWVEMSLGGGIELPRSRVAP